MSIDLKHPLLLEALNTVPLSRTPWAGQRIASLLAGREERMGECWEFSCDPFYPSKIWQTNIKLRDVIAAHPIETLSQEIVERTGPYCQLMVKLLNAARPLSLQVHPAIDAGGKWESWLALDAESDSEVYVGFAAVLTREKLHDLIATGASLKHLLGAMTVKEYDYFEIPPHTPHAVGAGSVMLEIQCLEQGQSGKTLRLWDWGHRYDAHGQLDMARGEARELAVTEALSLISPQTQVQGRGDFKAEIKLLPQVYHETAGFKVMTHARNPHYQVFSLRHTARLTFTLQIEHGYGILIFIRGTWEVHTQKIRGYRPAFIPATVGKMEITATCDCGEAVLIGPAISTVTFGSP